MDKGVAMNSKTRSRRPSAEKMVPIVRQVINNFTESQSASEPETLRVIGLNTNGLRAGLKKGLDDFVKQEFPDVLFIGETKIGQKMIEEFLTSPDFKKTYLARNYRHAFSCSVLRQGYSGTAIFIKNSIIPIRVLTDIPLGDNLMADEGRAVMAEFNQFVLLYVYIPNSGQKLEMLAARCEMEAKYREALNEMKREYGKPIVYCGDLNVVAEAIDIHDISKYKQCAGVTDEEREEHRKLKAETGLVDCFRYLHPDTVKYSWFSAFNPMAEQGWRLDYYMVSEELLPRVIECDIMDKKREFSDHVPITLSIRTQ